MKRKIEISYKLSFAVAILLSISLGFVLHILFLEIINDDILVDILPTYKSENNSSNMCINETLFDTAYCLRSHLAEFYKYNLSNVGVMLNESQLKIQGGVCSHYAEWYKQQAKKLGMNAITSTFKINDSGFHEIAIISNDEGYCLLDQLTMGCQELVR